MSIAGIKELLPQLRREKGWGRERLSHAAYSIDNEGTSAAQIAAIETGTRRASARTMTALAKALDVDPEIFPEYRVAIARIALDESTVGLERAISTLEQSQLEPVEITLEEIKKASRQGRAKVPDELAEGTVRRAKQRSNKKPRQ